MRLTSLWPARPFMPTISLNPRWVFMLLMSGAGRDLAGIWPAWWREQLPGLAARTWRAARNTVTAGAREVRNSVWKPGYLNECRKYCPSLELC